MDISGSRFSIVAAFLHERPDMSDDAYEGFLKAKEAALLAELAAVRAALADIARLTGSPDNAEASSKKQKTKRGNKDASTASFGGLSLSDAVYEVLSDSDVPLSPGQIWAVLHKDGFEVFAEDPVKAVAHALRKRVRTHNDIARVAQNRWNLRSRYTKAKLRKIAKANTGTGNLSREEHIEITKQGIARHLAGGGRVGQPPKITTEKLQEIVRLLADGVSVSEIAKRYGVSKQTVYARVREVQERAPYS